MTAQLERWKGDFGDAYTARNRVDWIKRCPFWEAIIHDLKPERVLEVGCNAGWNLAAIKAADYKVQCVGIEPNETARKEAQLCGYRVEPEFRGAGGFDIVFTAGVLIHVAPADLPDMMQRIVDASRRYVICIEYEADEETEIEYRGEMGLLWKRPYGKLYEAMGLKIIGNAFLPAESGFDRCTYWLLEKPAAAAEEAIYSAA